MALPILEYPTYEIELTSRGKTKFRPFLVKEQKMLMMAVEAKDLEASVKAIKQCIASCVLEEIDVDSLPMVDLELLFVNLRARSMGEIMDVYYKCTNLVEDKPCNMVMDVSVNLLEVKPTEIKSDGKIPLSDKIGVKMHYPSFDLLDLLIRAENNTEAEFIVIAGCIDYIYDANQVYPAKDATPEEIQNFVTTLPTEKYELLKNYVTSAPKVRKEIDHKCPKCHYEHKMVLEGIQDFFI